MRHRKQVLSRAIVAMLLTVATAGAQNYQIRTRVDLVIVPVTVKNSDNHLVSGLTKADFKIFENGKEQTISNFTIDPVPLSAAVLIDTGLTTKSYAKIQETLPALSGAFSQFDEVAVYRFDKYVAKLADFTTSKEIVEASLNKLNEIQSLNPPVPSEVFSSPSPMINGWPVVPSRRPIRPIPEKEIKVLDDAMFTAANDLAQRPKGRRHMLLIVSDGRSGANEHSYDQALTRLLEANVQVYSIGVDLALLSRRLSVLEKYAKSTGGDAFFLEGTHALESSYNQAALEARNQYVLGYFSTNEAPGPLPMFRQIAVRATRPGLAVLHRRGYYQYP